MSEAPERHRTHVAGLLAETLGAWADSASVLRTTGVISTILLLLGALLGFWGSLAPALRGLLPGSESVIQFKVPLAAVLAVLAASGFFFTLLLQLILLRGARSHREELRAAELRNLETDDFEKFDEIKNLREEKARADFERNVKAAFLLKRLDFTGTSFFANSAWVFQPGVNVLLGRNGYGKTLLLRAVAALLQSDEGASADLLQVSDEARISLALEMDSQPVQIARGRRRFTESVGKVPILAIPDSRFLNRSRRTVEPPREPFDLRGRGAEHFLNRLPYADVFHGLLHSLCLDYLAHKRSFAQPSFHLLEQVVSELMESPFEFDSIERSGPTDFEIKVRTADDPRPVLIQDASQGTLSVLAIFGLIRSFLGELFPGLIEADELLQQPAVVLIDELDAHLHPKWHQRLVNLLRDQFPNVQFVVSAHSPLIVAGCWTGEVAVLRRSEVGFALRQLERDFVGVTAEELYRDVFEVEEIDEAYAEYETAASLREDNSDRINALEGERERGVLSELGRRELARLHRENGIIRKIGETRGEVRDEELRVAELEAEVDVLRRKLGEADAGRRG